MLLPAEDRTFLILQEADAEDVLSYNTPRHRVYPSVLKNSARRLKGNDSGWCCCGPESGMQMFQEGDFLPDSQNTPGLSPSHDLFPRALPSQHR